MFDKEFDDKLRESMDSPRDMGFDEGAWQNLTQQMDLLGAAAGGSSAAGTAGKVALLAGKSWLAAAAVVTLLATSTFFFFRWQQAEQSLEMKQEAMTESVSPEMNQEEGVVSSEVEEEKTRVFSDEKSTPSMKMEQIIPQGPSQIFSENRETHNQRLHYEKKQESQAPIIENEIKHASVEKEINIDTILFSGESITISLPGPKVAAAPHRPAANVESMQRSLPQTPLKLALEASQSRQQADSLPPFKGQALGLRVEYWLGQRLALQAGLRQEVAETFVGEDDIDHRLQHLFQDPPRPFGRDSRLIEASFYQKNIQIPMGLRYVLFQTERTAVCGKSGGSA